MNTDKQTGFLELTEALKQAFSSDVASVETYEENTKGILPSGSLTLDVALKGGYPRGRIVELYGTASSGKTTLALLGMAEVNKLGGKALFMDMEHHFDHKWAILNGVDRNQYILNPQSAEEAFAMIELIAASRAVDLLVIDSVATLISKQEIGKSLGRVDTDEIQERLMSEGLKRISGAVASSGLVVIFINQMRRKSSLYGTQTINPGDDALQFYASVRVEMTEDHPILKRDNNQQELLGSVCRAVVTKNKVAPKGTSAELTIYYKTGVSREHELIQQALDCGLVTRDGNHFIYGDYRLGNGISGVKEYLDKERPDLREELVQKIMATVA
ncbi:MAG: DNA recombination/repair protein RecA [Streptococcaceae bacterium]|jgi:recombination protein RecA|nr:DNA recombination/repair protein RecA [Streptococcaceae bacterium]